MMVMLIVPLEHALSAYPVEDSSGNILGENAAAGAEVCSGTSSLGVHGAGSRSGTDQRRDASQFSADANLDSTEVEIFSFDVRCEGSGLAPTGLIWADP